MNGVPTSCKRSAIAYAARRQLAWCVVALALVSAAGRMCVGGTAETVGFAWQTAVAVSVPGIAAGSGTGGGLHRDEARPPWQPLAEPVAAGSESAAPNAVTPRTALWPFSAPRRRAIYDSAGAPVTPHPAVARIIVPERGVTAYGTGTLVDVRDQYGLVVTNWHVVQDSQGVIEVIFPSGFRSHARALKVDSDWDLAALVIWRPPIEPVKLAAQPPRPGDLLTIHGYGRGQYRIATGRCTSYYAPHRNFPLEMVEVDVEARQGDSGGPIFNQSGELAGVLFGAGEGTTLGSFGPRVSVFLASLAPDIGQADAQAEVAVADRPAPNVQPRLEHGWNAARPQYPSSPWTPGNASATTSAAVSTADVEKSSCQQIGARRPDESLAWSDIAAHGWYDPIKSALAIVGLVAIGLQLVKIVR